MLTKSVKAGRDLLRKFQVGHQCRHRSNARTQPKVSTRVFEGRGGKAEWFSATGRVEKGVKIIISRRSGFCA